MSQDRLRVLGIDTGAANIGWGVVEWRPGGDLWYVASGVREPEGDDLGERLYALGQWAMRLACEHGPFDATGYEQVFFRAAKAVQQRMAFHTGAILGVVGYAGAKGYRPQDIKSAVTGQGSASKAVVARLVAYHLRMERAAVTQMPDHETDALAVAITRAGEAALERRAG